jgi:hypothetical protein
VNDPTLFDHDIDDLLLEARGLALVTGILEGRGVSADAIAAHERELERTRARLAGLIASAPAA